jgi:two-component system, NtrC family, sensor histidine kinase KinB
MTHSIPHEILKTQVGHVVRTRQSIIVADTTADDRWLAQEGDAASEAAWSVIGVPLAVMTEGVTFGAMLVSRPGVAQYQEEDVSLLNSVAGQLASTLGLNHLHAENVQHAQEIAAFMEAMAGIASTFEVETIYSLITQHLVNLTRLELGVLLTWEATKGMLANRLGYKHGRGQTTQLLNLTTSHLLYDLAQAPRSLQLQASLTTDPSQKELLQQINALSLLILPLQAHQELFGFVVLLNQEKQHLFEDSELSLYQTLANQAAVAIQNAHLYTETQRQLKITRLLNDASQVINSTLDLDQIMQALLAQMNEFLQAEAVSIALVDNDTGELVYKVGEGVGSAQIIGLRVPANQGISGWVMQHNAPALVNNMREDPRFFRAGDQRTGHKTEAMICAPIQVHGNVLGTIQAINPAARTQFTEEELQLLVNLANLASSAMANAQQYQHTQAAEARYMGLFEDNIDPIILTDKSGWIMEVNGAAVELLEYERSELLRMRINQLHPIETGLLGERSFQPIQTRQIKMFNSEIISKTRRRIPVEVYAKRIYREDSETLQWIYHDITNQVELAQMRDDLTAMLFHDLRSPLGNIITSLLLVQEDWPPDMDEGVTSMLDVAIKSSQSLQRLVKSLLDINRLEAGNSISAPQKVSLGTLLDDAYENVQGTLERRRIVIEGSQVAPDFYLLVDDDMILRVIINLLDNALKYSQDGQQIMVEVGEPDEQGFVCLSVSDEGPGIPRRYREVIFEKFRRIEDKEARKGIGLGLAFCRLAVEAHGGKIWVDSGARGGARFNFTLPMAK